MELINKDLILKEIPLFSDLSDDELSMVRLNSLVAEYRKGEIIYEEGSCPSAFYCIIVGRIIISSKDYHGKETVLEYLHRGKYFGIISLLTGEPHSVTARAVNDCLLLLIKDEDFGVLLKKLPRIAIDLSKSLSRRLKRKSLHQKTIFESTIISVFSFYPKKDKSFYSLNLALSLKNETRKSVIIVELSFRDKAFSLPEKLGIKEGEHKVLDLFAAEESKFTAGDFVIKDKFGLDLLLLRFSLEDQSYLRKIVDVLSLFVNDYHYIILDLASGLEKQLFFILNQSDIIHLLVNPAFWDLRRNGRLMSKLGQQYHFPAEKIEIVINNSRSSLLGPDEQAKLLGHDIYATIPAIEENSPDRLVQDAPFSAYSKAIRRIARQKGDCQVGLVLGIGVAYGLCHIGVLKVIEENKIPVDVIAGSSMGAVIASLWAVGKSSQEILQITKEFKEPKYIWELVDLTIPFLGFIKGNKLYNFLKRHLGNKTFYDVKIPLKIAASDLRRKEVKVLDKGLLVDAIMASCAMPGVFNPFIFKEDMLFDGGVVTPLPTEALFEMGIRKIIAVNVTPSREDIMRQCERIKENTDSAKVSAGLWGLKHYLRDKLKINILDIIFSSFEMLQSEVACKEAQLADVVLHPDTSGLHWLELNKAEAFAQRGEEETKKSLGKIWNMVNE